MLKRAVKTLAYRILGKIGDQWLELRLDAGDDVSGDRHDRWREPEAASSVDALSAFSRMSRVTTGSAV